MLLHANAYMYVDKALRFNGAAVTTNSKASSHRKYRESSELYATSTAKPHPSFRWIANPDELPEWMAMQLGCEGGLSKEKQENKGHAWRRLGETDRDDAAACQDGKKIFLHRRCR